MGLMRVQDFFLKGIQPSPPKGTVNKGQIWMVYRPSMKRLLQVNSTMVNAIYQGCTQHPWYVLGVKLSKEVKQQIMTNLSPNLCCHSPTIALSNLVSNMVLLEQKSGAGSVNHYLVSSIFCSINQQTSVERTSMAQNQRITLPYSEHMSKFWWVLFF